MNIIIVQCHVYVIRVISYHYSYLYYTHSLSYLFMYLFAFVTCIVLVYFSSYAFMVKFKLHGNHWEVRFTTFGSAVHHQYGSDY